MPKTPVWQLPYPALADPADITGVDAVDDLAQRLEVLLTQLQSGASIPGEVKLWPGGALPTLATYGHWVWADGGIYVTATYPKASANIAAAWRTAHGQADPGAANFRVPDLRGLTPVGMDAMPGGARANRIVRSVAITIAAKTGEELHTITLAESAAHAHGITDPAHAHSVSDPTHVHGGSFWVDGGGWTAGGAGAAAAHGGVAYAASGIGIYANGTGISVQNAGGGGAHENLPPTVFVPWIVKLDD